MRKKICDRFLLVVVAIGIIMAIGKVAWKEVEGDEKEKKQVKAINNFKKDVANSLKQKDSKNPENVKQEGEELIKNLEKAAKKLGDVDDEYTKVLSEILLAGLHRKKPADIEFLETQKSMMEGRFFNYQKMINENDFEWNKGLIVKYRNSVEKLIKLEKSSLSFIKIELADTSLSEKKRKSVYSGFEKKLKKNVPRNVRYYDAHLDLCKSLETLIEFLELSKDKYKLNDKGELIFDNDELLKKHQHLYDEYLNVEKELRTKTEGLKYEINKIFK